MPPMTTTAPKLAAFPKAYMQALCRDGSMTLAEWIELATPLGTIKVVARVVELELAKQKGHASALVE